MSNPTVIYELFESASVTATFNKGGHANAIPLVLGSPAD
jgi:hypothetical protein